MCSKQQVSVCQNKFTYFRRVRFLRHSWEIDQLGVMLKNEGNAEKVSL